jgi:post-segregation antitoxin (ccd killing protein)
VSLAPYDKHAPKKAVIVSVNAGLAAKAKALGIDFSEALESRLAELVAGG